MKDQRIVLVLLLCLIAGSNAQGSRCDDSSRNLMNMVVYEGNSSYFTNQADAAGVKWEIDPSSPPNVGPDTVAEHGETTFPSAYSVNPTQLNIRSASVFPRPPYNNDSISGLYTVTYKTNPCQAKASLIVVYQGPMCRCDEVDSMVTLICTIGYGVTRTLPSLPVLTWTTDTGSETPYESPTHNQDNPNYDVSTSTYLITSSGAASYTCGVTFNAPDATTTPSMASNKPSFYASCSIANCAKKTPIEPNTSIGPTTNTATGTFPPTTGAEIGTTTGEPHSTKTGEMSSCSQNFSNTVVYEGTPVSFPRLNNGQQVQWSFVPSNDPLNEIKSITDYNDIVPVQYNTTYAVDSSQLKILKATTAPEGTMPDPTAGLYILEYRSPSCKTAAHLIVIKNGGLLCSCNASDANNAKLICSVDFAESNSQPAYPIITWKTDSGTQVAQNQPLLNQNDPYTKRSELQTTISRSSVSQYECQLTFSAPRDPLSYTSPNAPNFTASCFVPNCAKTTTTSIESTTINHTTSTSCPKNLINIVVNEGSVAEFENVDDGSQVKWHFSSSSDPKNNLLDITNYDNTVNPMFVGAYNVTKTKLTILDATVAPKGNNSYATAGVYFLTYQSSGCQTAANLIVIQRGPVCDRNESHPNNVTLSCNISYAESERQPSYPTMTWTTGGVVIQSDQPTTLKYAFVNKSLSQIRVNNTAPSSYQCQVTFKLPAPAPIPFLAQNAPSYNESCTVASATVPPNAITEIATTTAAAVPQNANTEIATTTAAAVPQNANTEIATTTAAAIPQNAIAEIVTTTAGTFSPTTNTEIATTTAVCVDRPICQTKWLSNLTAFCPLVPAFRNDCPAFCKVC